MPFTRPTLQTIVDRIESDIEQRLTGNVPLLQVAFLRILARVFAGAIHVCYGWLSWLADQLFWDTAEDTMLDRHARLWGLTRKAASYAVGNIEFTGSNGTNILGGTKLVTSDGIEFQTDALGTIAGGVATIASTAVEAGDSGNVAGSLSLELLEPIAGITAAETGSGGFTGGEDDETDNSLRKRIDTRISTPPAGGSHTDFETWANEVDGVADAWTFGNDPSIGYVTMVVKAAGSNPVPSSALLTDVEDYITARMPVTTNLIVSPIVDIEITMTIDITIVSGGDQANTEAAITANLESYFDDEGEPGGTLLISQIRNAISTTGVADYEITAMAKDGTPVSIDNLVFTGFEYPVLGTITYT